MKKTKKIKFVMLGLFSLVLPLAAAQNVTFSWNYTNPTPPDSFVLYSTTNLSLPSLPTNVPATSMVTTWTNASGVTNWIVWTPLTNIVNPILATNYNTNLNYTSYTVGLVTNAVVPLVPGQGYYCVCGSNIWGLSPFFNVISTPPVVGDAIGLSLH